MGYSACNDTPAANIPQLYTQPTFHLPTEFNTPINLIRVFNTPMNLIGVQCTISYVVHFQIIFVYLFYGKT